MMTDILIVATNNEAKFREIRQIAEEYGILARMPAVKTDVQEGVVSYEENALLKASSVTAQSGADALGEDSGIEVTALGGFPGVISARFVEGSDQDRNNALLERMKTLEPSRRQAVFKACVVISLVSGGHLTGYGELRGHITDAPEGGNGFGYDPIFIPDGFDRTLGLLDGEEKNRISHRRKAIESAVRQYRDYKNTVKKQE